MAESLFSDAEMAAKTDKGFGQTSLFLEAKTQNLYHTASPRWRSGCSSQLPERLFIPQEFKEAMQRLHSKGLITENAGLEL